MMSETRLFLTVALLGIVDVVIPIPILGLILIYVIVQKPPWFLEMVRGIYREA